MAILLVLILGAVPGAGLMVTAPQDDETWIQPGARLITPQQQCTGGFILTDAAGTFYMATAGHCFGDNCETPHAARVQIGSLGPVGTKVLCYDRGLGTDMALVRIDAAHADAVDPAIRVWGGPTADDGPADGVLRHYGHGVVYDGADETRARSGVGLHHGEASFRMAGLVVNGDSGGPVRLDSGAAVGILTHANGNVLGAAAHSAPYAYGTTMTRVLALSAAAGYDLTLVTAPTQ